MRPLRSLACMLTLVVLPQTRAFAVVDTVTPVQGPPVSAPLPFPDPALGATGGFPFQAPPGLSSPSFVHEGQYTWGADIAIPPVQLESPVTNCKGQVMGQILPIDPKQASSALATHAGSALDEAAMTLGQFDAGGAGDFFAAIDDFLAVLDLLPGASLPDPHVGNTQPSCLAYEPLRARWLAGEYAKATPTSSFETRFNYPDPSSFREIRERGARLYCAARTAQFIQGDQVFSMGERVGFSVSVLGNPIDFFVTEPTLVLDGPERFTGMGANDGAQAFEVPLLLGTRITPIRGLLLPGFREVRVPVSLVAADSEVRTHSNLRFIPRPGQIVLPGYSDTHHTVTHVDAIRSAQKHASLGVLEPASIELFRAGPLAVQLGFSVDYGVGVLAVEPGRALYLPGVPGARTGRLWMQGATGRRNHDGAWQPRYPIIGLGFPVAPHWAVRPDGLSDAFWQEPITTASLLSPPPLDIRLLQNDDHAVTSTTSLELTGTLTAEAGCCSFPPFDVSLSLTGGVGGTVSQIFHVRDSLLAQDQGAKQMTPITGLGVRSSQTAHAALQKTTATFRFRLDLPGPFLDDIDFTKTLFEVDGVDLAKYDSDDELDATNPAGDSENLRLGTGSSSGNVLKKPLVFSHLPSTGGEFQSFPTSVDACLADPTPNPPTPGLCDPVPAQGNPGQAELCVYGPSNLLEGLLQAALPSDVCDGKIDAFVASLPLLGAQAECIQSYLEFLCSGVSQQQPLDGSYSDVVSHVLEFEQPAELAAFQSMLETCGKAFGQLTRTGGITGADAIAEQLLSFGVCDVHANLMDGDEILGAIDPGVPPLESAPPCH